MPTITLAHKTRPILISDQEMLRRHRNEPSTRVFLGDDREISVEQQRTWWETHDPNSYRIVTCFNEDVGIIRVTDVLHGSACVGGDVFAAFRGRGHGGGVFAAACRHAKYHLGATKTLWLKVFLQNTAAVKIYLRAGFVFVPDAPVEHIGRVLPGTSKPAMLHYARMEKNR